MGRIILGDGAGKGQRAEHPKLQGYPGCEQCLALGLFAGYFRCVTTGEVTWGCLLPCWQAGPVWPGAQLHSPVRGSHWPRPQAQNWAQSFP